MLDYGLEWFNCQPPQDAFLINYDKVIPYHGMCDLVHSCPMWHALKTMSTIGKEGRV